MKKMLTGWVVVVLALFVMNTAFAADIKDVFEQNCKKCHGVDGKGQTSFGKKLKAPDFTDPSWQAKNSKAKLQEGIEKGSKDKEGKELMKPYKDKLTPEEIQGLTDYVKKFAPAHK